MARSVKIRGLRARASEILPGLLHLSFQSHKQLISTFMRVREFFESTEFKNASIDLRSFRSWYSENVGNGSFSYAEDWAAFNLPLEIFEEFEKVQSHLKVEEKRLLRFLKSRVAENYVIATSKAVESDSRYLRHEVAHFLFASNSNYRREVKAVLRTIDRKPIFQWLKDQNYHSFRLWDEAHSYLLDGASFLREDVKTSPLPYRYAIKRLKKILRKYHQKSRAVIPNC